ncbi:MAG TPA: tryptophan 7-halogenase [Blastocatellia bacterium]|nr:tryptophan 7-halogenase [Blastocatellia bacterium]
MGYDVIVVGGGPAGSSAAIGTARAGLKTLLLEEKRMPREKLCGEFITPESFPSLKRLGVFDRLLDAGAQRITSLTLVPYDGSPVATQISEMSSLSPFALSFDRARLDHILFERAREAGAECLEGMAVSRVIVEDDLPCGVEALSLREGKTHRFESAVVVDASGRNSRLTLTRRERMGGTRGSRLYALKAHFESVKGIEDQVELYFFPDGYGGLSRVGDGKVNLCFLASERAFRLAAGDPHKIVELTIMRNRLAGERLQKAEPSGRWLGAGPLTFGPRRLWRSGVLAAGDSSGMIDPFTGTGIQIALRAGELVAEAITSAAGEGGDLARRAISNYRAGYEREFGRRMMVAGLLRRAVFSPAISSALSEILARTPWLARWLLRATRA